MNELLLIVASNVAVACLIAIVAHAAGRWGKSADLTHLLWMAVFIKLITPPIAFAPINVPSSWELPLAHVLSIA